MTNITLTLPDDLAQQVEAYARETGQSLSVVVEEYLRKLVPAAPTKLPELPPEIARLRGTIRLPEGTDYKQVLADAMQERHGQ